MDQYESKRVFGGIVQVPMCDRSVIGEISGDFTLPDYQPEIKKLIRVSANILPATRYVGDRCAELSGNVDYYVIYTGSDNQIYCAPLTAEYKIEVPFDTAEESLLENTVGYAAIVAIKMLSCLNDLLVCSIKELECIYLNDCLQIRHFSF